MERKDFKDQMVDYLYGELDAEQRKAFEDALQCDEELAEELASFQKLREDLSSLEDEEFPAHLNTSLLAEATKHVSVDEASFLQRLRVNMRSLVLNPAFSAAMVMVAVLGVSLYIYNQSPGPQSRERSVDPISTMALPEGTVGQTSTKSDEEKEAKIANNSAGRSLSMQKEDSPNVAKRSSAPIKKIRKKTKVFSKRREGFDRATDKGAMGSAPKKARVSRKGSGAIANAPAATAYAPKNKSHYAEKRRSAQQRQIAKKAKYQSSLDDLLEGSAEFKSKRGAKKEVRAPKQKTKEEELKLLLSSAKSALNRGDCQSMLIYLAKAQKIKPALKKELPTNKRRCLKRRKYLRSQKARTTGFKKGLR